MVIVFTRSQLGYNLYISLVFPGTTHSLKTLHTILSTGSPLKPQSFEYVYRDIKEDLLLGSITGEQGQEVTLLFFHFSHIFSMPFSK